MQKPRSRAQAQAPLGALLSAKSSNAKNSEASLGRIVGARLTFAPEAPPAREG